MKSLGVTSGRLSIIAIVAVVCSAAVFLLGKAAFDWRLQRLDEAVEPSRAKLDKWVDQANATRAKADQQREYPFPHDLVDALAKPSEFHLSRKMADVPVSVRSAFAKAAGEASFLMADPGGKWQATDVIHDPKLAVRRLSAVAVGKVFCLLFYEHGGIGRYDRVAVFRMTDGHAEAIWHANIRSAADSPSDLAKLLQKGEYQEAPFF